MNNFKDFNIQAQTNAFKGDKVKIDKVLNREIIVQDYKIVNSKFEESKNGKCLHLQIKFKDEQCVLFTGSVYLMDVIGKIPKDKFPFRTTIIKENQSLLFT